MPRLRVIVIESDSPSDLAGLIGHFFGGAPAPLLVREAEERQQLPAPTSSQARKQPAKRGGKSNRGAGDAEDLHARRAAKAAGIQCGKCGHVPEHADRRKRCPECDEKDWEDRAADPLPAAGANGHA